MNQNKIKNETNSIRIGLTKECATIDIDTIHLDLPLLIRPTMAVFLFGSLLLVRSFRLSCVTTSTTQSEYYMMSAASAEAIYIMELYNNVLLPIINNVLKVEFDKVKSMPIIVSKLAAETIDTLNSKN